jgi:hemerythrin-like domain-containing protein
MPIVIGAKQQSNFTDPIGLLTDCHRRIERFLSVLLKVSTEVHGGPLNGDQRTSLETALRYFHEAAPKHTADEEQSLFPRLRQMDRAEVKQMLARVDALEQDHVRAGENHAEVHRLGQKWLAAGMLPTADAGRFSVLLEELSNLYRAHIAVEEDEVFPLADQSLSAPERQAIGGEMAERRGLSRMG